MPFVMVDEHGNKTNTHVPAPNYNPNDTLAEIIVDAWRSQEFKNDLLNNGDRVFRARGLYFLNPRVVDLATFNRTKYAEGEAIFVLPEPPPNLPALGNLLDSARAAMAYTPVGI